MERLTIDTSLEGPPRTDTVRDIVVRVESAIDQYIDRLAEEARLTRERSRQALPLQDKLALQRRAKIILDHRKRVIRQRFEIIDQTCAALSG
jgi:hypothetical protein